MKKKLKKFFTIFFLLFQKIQLVSSLENSPYSNFFPQDDRAIMIYNFLLLRPCTLFVLETSQISEYLSKFGIGNIIYHDPTASKEHTLLLPRKPARQKKFMCSVCSNDFLLSRNYLDFYTYLFPRHFLKAIRHEVWVIWHTG